MQFSPLLTGRLGVALGGDDPAVLGGDHDAAARSAEPAYALVPLPVFFQLGGGGLGELRTATAHRGGGGGGDGGFHEFTAGEVHEVSLGRVSVEFGQGLITQAGMGLKLGRELSMICSSSPK